ncbi:MAG: hypothetical protein M1818_006498 [Claussenomyces sp. TS43310]|nr:MAG: hypothetical protein M1818_006498 [Claussenomyces sp. TS43310]
MAHESAVYMAERITPESPSPLASFYESSGFHTRRYEPQPPTQGQDDDLIHRVRRSLHFGGSAAFEQSHKALGDDRERRHGGIRNLIRRASISLKTKARPRRNTLSFASSSGESSEHRPSTAASTWHKLRQAASFRHTKSVFDIDHEFADSCSELAAPIPGNGNAPPIIPRGSGGAAARATAARLNEYLERTRHLYHLEDSQGDAESGIGIALTANAPMRLPGISISQVDFVKRLPLELAIQILSHLDHHGLAKAALVSRDWLRVSSNRHVWREAFYREKSSAYAMSGPVLPGTGLGIPAIQPDTQWKEIYKVKQQLQTNWKYGKAKPVFLSGHLDSIYCVQFDEKKIITGSRDKTIRVWNMHAYKCELVIGPADVVQKSSILYGEDRKPVHSAFAPKDNVTAESIPRILSYPVHHDASILCLQYDDEILATGSSDGTCIIYDLQNDYRPVRRLEKHTAAVLDLAFDKKHIVTCSKDVTICVWERQTGALLKQLRGHTGPVNAVQLRGNTIVSCSGDFSVKLWNLETGRTIRELLGHTKGLACSQFSADSRYIASAGNDKVIRVWDANTGECLRQMAAHDNLVRSLHIDSVSGRLVSGSYDQDIKVFDLDSGRLVLDFPNWHASWVLGAKSDYRRIVSTGQLPKILIMDFGAGIDGIELLESAAAATATATAALAS